MRNRRPRAYRHSLKEDDPGNCGNVDMETQVHARLCDTKDAEGISRRNLRDPELPEKCFDYAEGMIVSSECHRAEAKNNEGMLKPEIRSSEDHPSRTSLSGDQDMVCKGRLGSDSQLEADTAESGAAYECTVEKSQDGAQYDRSLHRECHNAAETNGCSPHYASVGDPMIQTVAGRLEHSWMSAPIEAEVLKQIKEILNVAGRFSTYLAAKTELSDVESLSIDGMACKAYCCDVLGEGMRSIRFSESFIYNKRIWGKSGSLIFFTEDFKHVIKVIKPKELNVFMRNMSVMSRYLDKSPQSLIVRSVGVYSTPNMNFIVMENVFDSNFGQIFDLKGMNVRRRPMKISTESDWMGNRIQLRDKECMMKTIGEDTLFLESLNLMDYSLVIGRNRDHSGTFRAYDGEGNETVLKVEYSGGYSLGIVDVLTEYDYVKKLERISYLVCCMDNASAVDPREYRNRFMDLVCNECFEEEEPIDSQKNK